MNINLPPRIDGNQPAVLQDARQVTIIGANGSGKSRFCDALVREVGNKAYRISALRALYPARRQRDILEGSIDDMFNKINEAHPNFVNSANNEFDKLSYVMLFDEFRQLMGFKARQLMKEEGEFPKTRLDMVVKVWQEVFPKNKVLRENGKLMFSNSAGDDKFAAVRLSDGEKAVLYHIAAVLYAMPDAVIIVDDPEVFIHHSTMVTLWNSIEEMRPDCTFIYNTHDVEFASSRVDNQCIWVKAFDPAAHTWDYEVMPTSQDLDEALYFDILGSRKPVLFIEGDEVHSIDSKLYPLIFPEYVVKPMGSCNKVIEVVRSFGDLHKFHHIESRGIVDRDRRGDQEVRYLRQKNILVPNVAEVENIFLLETVVRGVARYKHRNEQQVMSHVKQHVIREFELQLKQQALQHVRHRVKHDVEKRIDMKFRSINALEDHMIDLVNELNPRGFYEDTCRKFRTLVHDLDYAGILKVFNHKPLMGECGVAEMCGYHSKEEYIKAVLGILKSDGPISRTMRDGIKAIFDYELEEE